MVKIDQLSKESVNDMLGITYTVPTADDIGDVKKSLGRFWGRLDLHRFNDIASRYKFEFDKSGKVYAHILLVGDNVPSKKWILNTLKEDYQHDAPKS